MIGDDHRLTAGYLARHIPPGSRLGLDIAVLDIAQDFLLSHLEELGFFSDLIVFKGGTALRKFFAGSEGRFSTDLDLASRDLAIDRDELAGLIAEQTAVSLGPFDFQPRENRGRWTIKVRSEFGDPAIGIKLDVGPPCWLAPEERPFVKTPAQSRYGFVPPAVPVMRLEEILAEKVARLTRVATARDASDLGLGKLDLPAFGILAPTRPATGCSEGLGGQQRAWRRVAAGPLPACLRPRGVARPPGRLGR